MKASKFDVATISVGNLSMGGTGKSPHIEFLIRLLKDHYKVATLSRGFGRTERGFIIADEQATANTIGDEPLQFYKKFGDQITVSVEANRVLGAMDLFYAKPETEVLLLDDAYQHRAIHRDFNILLTDYNHPYYSDFILPVGNLRESKSGKKRADAVIVTKCPKLTDTEKKVIISKLKLTKSQSVYFSSINYDKVLDFKGEEVAIDGQKVALVTGIANADPLINYLSDKVEIVKHFKFNDHHKFRLEELTEIHNFIGKFASENPIILTTEKDAMRLMCREFDEVLKKDSWAYQSIKIEIDKEGAFRKEVLSYVEKDN